MISCSLFFPEFVDFQWYCLIFPRTSFVWWRCALKRSWAWWSHRTWWWSWWAPARPQCWSQCPSVRTCLLAPAGSKRVYEFSYYETIYLYYNDKLDAVRLVERAAPLLMVMRVPEVPARRVQQAEIVPKYSFINSNIFSSSEILQEIISFCQSLNLSRMKQFPRL